MTRRHKWDGDHCRYCGIRRKPNAKYKGRFDYLIKGAWEFYPFTPPCFPPSSTSNSQE